jgi:hypothetical protein
MQANTQAELTTRGGFPNLAYTWKSTSQNGIDSGCRTGAVILSQGVQISTAETLGTAYSDNRLLTTWSMFSATNAMYSVDSMLYVTLGSSFQQAGNNIPFSLPSITPRGQIFNSAVSSYTCNVTGTYFFAMTAGVAAIQQAQVQLIDAETYDTYVEMIRLSTSSTDLTTLSRNTLATCEAGAQIAVYLVQGQVEPGTTAESLLSFTAFEYKLATPSLSSAWSVARSTNWTVSSTALDPLSFDTSLFPSYGSLSWDGINSRVTIYTGGYYYVYLSAGVKPYSGMRLTIKRNSDNLFGVYRLATNHNDVDTIGHGMVVQLYAGDQLRVIAEPNTSGYSSNIGLQTSFFGMLLYTVA